MDKEKKIRFQDFPHFKSGDDVVIQLTESDFDDLVAEAKARGMKSENKRVNKSMDIIWAKLYQAGIQPNPYARCLILKEVEMMFEELLSLTKTK